MRTLIKRERERERGVQNSIGEAKLRERKDVGVGKEMVWYL